MDRLQDFAGAVEHGDLPDDRDAAIETAAVIGTDERRMHVRAYNYWVSMLDGRTYPSVEDLELSDEADFGSNSVLLDFTHAGETPAIAWLGNRLREECGLPESVASVSEVPARSLLSRLTDHHLQIIANRAPIGFEAEFVNTRGNNTMYRGILLPFSSDDDTIDFIFGVINWKEVAPGDVTEEIAEELAQVAPLAPRPMVPAWADGPSGSPQAPTTATITNAVPFEGVDEMGWDDDADGTDETEVATPSADDALADWLAAARESASAALSADTRGRVALYRALGGAYDFALASEGRGEEFAELLADAKIKVQDRAPMTPVVKLIFGRDYDKTRLTEFAAALSFARRRELPTGGMRLFLENFPGGLKAIVAAERRERRPADKPVKPDLTRQAARAMPEQAYLTLPGDDEFVVLVARRVDSERVAIIGVAPDDKALLDRALRHIVGQN
jgi:hypothetical protein